MKIILYSSIILNLLLGFFLVALNDAESGKTQSKPTVDIKTSLIIPLQERARSRFKRFPVTSSEIAFIGDLYIDEGPWSKLFPAYPISKQGVFGDTILDVLHRLEYAIKDQPKKIFIMAGSVDVFLGHSATEISNNYAQILKQVKTESPSTRLHILSILPRSSEEASTIKTANHSLEEMAENYGYEYINLFDYFVDETGALSQKFTNDNKHLLMNGYDLIGEQIRQYMEAPL